MRTYIKNNRFLLAFTLLTSIMGVSVGLAKMTTSLYALELKSSETMLGLIAGSQMIGILIMSLPMGVFVDHFGPSRLFALGTLLAGLAYLSIPLVPSSEFLLLCSLLISFFMPLRFISLNTVFMEQLSKLGESKAGWFRGTHLLGFFLIGPLISTGLISALDYSGTFWLIGMVFFATIPLAPLVFSHYSEQHRQKRTLSWADISGQLHLLLGDKPLREVGLVEFFAQAVNGYYSFFIVVIAIETFHLDSAQASGLVAAQGCSLIFALFFLGRLASYLGQRRLYLLSYAWTSGALALLSAAPTAGWLWAGGLALGLGVGLLEIVNLTRFARLSAALGRGKVAGIYALVGPGGGLFGSLLGGGLGQVLGLQAVFLLFVPVFFLFAGLLLMPAKELVKEKARRIFAAVNPLWALLGHGLVRTLKWLAAAGLAMSLAFGFVLVLRPILTTPLGLSIVLSLSILAVLALLIPRIKGRKLSAAFLASLLAITAWIVPAFAQHDKTQEAIGHFYRQIQSGLPGIRTGKR